MLKVTGTGNATTVEHSGAVLPTSTPVPSLRATVEDFGVIAAWFAHNHPEAASLVDGELRPISECLDTVRRFILTR